MPALPASWYYVTHATSAYVLYISRNRSIGLHFAADNIGLSSLKFFWWAPEFLFVSAVQGHPRSMNWCQSTVHNKCDFLLVPGVRNSNLSGPILHRFGDQTGFMCSWSHPYWTLILGVFRAVAPDRPCWASTIAYSAMKLFSKNSNQPIWSRYLNVTDGQTHGQTDGRHAIS